MALARVKIWVADEVLSAADLNGEFNNIVNNPISLISPFTSSVDAGGFDITNLDEMQFANAAADPTAATTPRVRNNAGTFKIRVQDARTNTVARPLGLIADTSGAAAASIGVGQLFQAESADEAPSDFGAIDFVATDVTAASEDTDFVVMLRDAGAAIAERFRVDSDGGVQPGAAAPDTPTANMLYRDNIVKAWLRWTYSGGVPAIGADMNVSSITDNALGDLTAVLATNMASANYGIAAIVQSNQYEPKISSLATTGPRILIRNEAGTPLDLDGALIVVGAQ